MNKECGDDGSSRFVGPSVIDSKKEDVRRRSSETIILFLRVKVGTDQDFRELQG